MNRDQFWLTDAQFSKIEPHLRISLMVSNDFTRW